MAIRRLKEISDSKRARIIEELKIFFQGRKEVIFALLYGSMVDPVVPQKYGDIDIAVFLKQEEINRPEYLIESEMEIQASKLLIDRGLEFPPIEIRVINNAPYSFLIHLFKSNFLILKENEEVFSDFIEQTSGKAMANSYFRMESLREVIEG